MLQRRLIVGHTMLGMGQITCTDYANRRDRAAAQRVRVNCEQQEGAACVLRTQLIGAQSATLSLRAKRER